MIRATVEFPVKSRAYAVDLTDDGWRHRGAAAPALECLPNGVVAFVREPDPEPDAAVS